MEQRSGNGTAGGGDPGLEAPPRPRWAAILGILAAAAAALAALALFGWWDERRHPERRYFSVDLGEIPPGAVIHVDLRRHGIYRFPHGLFLVRDGDEVLAFSAASPHLGEQVVWDEGDRVFRSPAHGETWDRRGRRLAGPAPRDLVRFPVLRQGNAVRIDLGTLIRGATRAGTSSDSVDAQTWITGVGAGGEVSLDP